jgi:hypothetical protein
MPSFYSRELYLNGNVMIQFLSWCWVVIHWLNLPRWKEFRIPTDKVYISIQVTSGTLIWMRPYITIKYFLHQKSMITWKFCSGNQSTVSHKHLLKIPLNSIQKNELHSATYKLIDAVVDKAYDIIIMVYLARKPKS